MMRLTAWRTARSRLHWRVLCVFCLSLRSSIMPMFWLPPRRILFLSVSYDAEHTTLEGLLQLVEQALDGRKAESVGIAAHDYGEAKFYLTGSGSFPRQL